MDEPNASLDSDGEKALTRAIQKLKVDGCSVIVISHRPAILSQVDQIMVLKDGTLIKYGPRDQILKELGRPQPKQPTITRLSNKSWIEVRLFY